MSKNLVLLAGFILLFLQLAHASVPDWTREAKAQLCGHALGELQSKLNAHAAEEMKVMYFDSKSLGNKSKGVYIRLRIEEDKAEVTLKYRQEALIDHPADADCEVDVSQGSAEGSCSWDIEVSLNQAKDVLKGNAHIISLLSRDQVETYKQIIGALPTEELVGFGPVQMKRWKIQNWTTGKKWRLEAWDLGLNETIHEVSYREEGDVSIPRIRISLNRFMNAKGLVRCTDEDSKADRVLASGHHSN